MYTIFYHSQKMNENKDVMQLNALDCFSDVFLNDIEGRDTNTIV